MGIKIGDAKSMGRTSNYNFIPDDRQTLQQVLDDPYVVVIDNGRHESGDKRTFTADFDLTNFALIKSYWENRTLVTVILETGETIEGMRVLITAYTPIKYFETSHRTVTIELWRK